MNEFKFNPDLPPSDPRVVQAMADNFRKQGRPDMADMLLDMYERIVVNKEVIPNPNEQ